MRTAARGAILTTALATTLLLTTTAMAQTSRLSLRCEGSARHPEYVTSHLWARNDQGDTASVDGFSQGRARDEASVAFEMKDGAARIRLPSDMRPALAFGGNDGWWPVQNLSVSDDEISGSYDLNFMNKPRIRIDRRSGSIEVEGRRAFHGQCENVADAPRKF